MMTINHLNLVVSDVGRSLDLFETSFGFVREQIKGNNAIAILTNSAGFTLVLMNGDDSYPRNFHFGFFVESIDEVEAIHRRLGHLIEPGNKPAQIRDTYGFYFHFDGLLIEVGHRLIPTT